MSKRLTIALMFAAVCLAGSAFADPQQHSSTGHFVLIDEGEVISLPNGRNVRVGGRNHANIVFESGPWKGQTASQWCDFMSHLNDAGQSITDAGFCTLYFDSGDTLWVSFVGRAGQPTPYTVMGGTGRLEGVTGSGSSTLVSARADGFAWTLHSKGTVTIK